MPERKPRADAERNRAAILEAAGELFARGDPDAVTMAAIATAAGVGKGTLFRGFGDRTGLIRALYESRTEPLVRALTEGPGPLGPGTPPTERVPAILDALACFKFDNRHLSVALEADGADSPYRAAAYDQAHGLLRDALEEIPGFGDGGFAAHALLAAVRADLIDHLAVRQGASRERIRADVAAYTARVLGRAGSTVPG